MVEAYNAVERRRRRGRDRAVDARAPTQVSSPSQGRDLQVVQARPGLREHARPRRTPRCMTVDCYGTMWDKTIKLPAYPCIGFSPAQRHGPGRDLRIGPAVGHDAHHLPGPDGQARLHQRSDRGRVDRQHHPGPLPGHAARWTARTAPPRRTSSAPSMERQEGVVPQVQMRVGQKVTQAILIGTDQMLYFTGEIIDAPGRRRPRLPHQDHRQGRRRRRDALEELVQRPAPRDLLRQHPKDLERFCRFAKIKLIDEAV